MTISIFELLRGFCGVVIAACSLWLVWDWNALVCRIGVTAIIVALMLIAIDKSTDE